MLLIVLYSVPCFILAFVMHRVGGSLSHPRLSNAAGGFRNAYGIGGITGVLAGLMGGWGEGAVGWLMFWSFFGFMYAFVLLLKVPPTRAARDVVEDASAMSAMARPFDPEKHIDIRRGVFVGLDGRRKPVFLPKNLVDKNHLEILGESGVGKSSIAGVLLSQLAAAGECVVVFDPKNDRNLPGALAKAGKEWGNYPVHVLDLRPQADFPQVNPFLNCRPDQVEELLQVALELGKTGDAGVDFYRGKDREATDFIAQALKDGKTDLLEILEKARNDERVTDQENLWRELKQVGRVKAIQAVENGLDLEAVLSKPGVLYVIGSTTKLEVVAAQKLILQRILQIIEERDDQSMPVALFLDELKYILSPAALRAAGTIRDRNCHLMFAHQSLGDLDDCPGLSPKAVRGAIWGNSGIKIVYKMLDASTAQELTKIAGSVAAADESTSTRDGISSVSVSTRQVDYMPAHVFTHLPKPSGGESSVGVVFGLGPAWYLSTRWIETGPAPRPIPAVSESAEIKKAEMPAKENPVEVSNAENLDDLLS